MNESGKIIEQGKFSDLNVPGRYIYSLNVNNPQSSTGVDDESLPANEDSTGDRDVAIQEQNQDSSRQTGDWATYKYYSAALGRWKLLIFLAFVIVNEAANGIQSMSSFSSLIPNRNP